MKFITICQSMVYASLKFHLTPNWEPRAGFMPSLRSVWGVNFVQGIQFHTAKLFTISPKTRKLNGICCIHNKIKQCMGKMLTVCINHMNISKSTLRSKKSISTSFKIKFLIYRQGIQLACYSSFMTMQDKFSLFKIGANPFCSALFCCHWLLIFWIVSSLK